MISGKEGNNSNKLGRRMGYKKVSCQNWGKNLPKSATVKGKAGSEGCEGWMQITAAQGVPEGTQAGNDKSRAVS